MTKPRYLVGLVMTCMVLTAPSVSAQASKPFDQEGVLEAIYLDQGRLVIYDVSYHFPKSARVYRFDPSGDPTQPGPRTPVSQQTLASGTRVGFTALYRPGSKQLPIIKEVWIWSH